MMMHLRNSLFRFYGSRSGAGFFRTHASFVSRRASTTAKIKENDNWKLIYEAPPSTKRWALLYVGGGFSAIFSCVTGNLIWNHWSRLDEAGEYKLASETERRSLAIVAVTVGLAFSLVPMILPSRIINRIYTQIPASSKRPENQGLLQPPLNSFVKVMTVQSTFLPRLSHPITRPLADLTIHAPMTKDDGQPSTSVPLRIRGKGLAFTLNRENATWDNRITPEIFERTLLRIPDPRSSYS